MILKFLKFEARQLLLPFAILYASVLSLALSARFDVFSIGDMPLLLAIIYSTTLLLIYRYWQSLHGSEAAFMFSLPMPTGRLVFSWLATMVSFCIVSSAVALFALAIQGMGMSMLLRGLPWYLAIGVFLLFFATIFFLLIPLLAAITIAHAERFRKRRLLWTAIVWLVIQGFIELLSKFTALFIPYYIEIGMDRFGIVSKMVTTPNTLSVSINTSIWSMLGAIPCVLLVYWVFNTRFQVLES